MHLNHHIRQRICVCLLAVALAVLCLTACSDEVLYTGTDSLVIQNGTGTRPDDSGALTLPDTESGITIRPTYDPYENAEHVMRVDFLETGDADAILLRVDETVILVDTGESDDYHVITTALGAYGITVIDYLIISHYDNDHIGTASQILKNYEVKTVYMPDYIRDSRLYRSLMDTLEILEADGKVAVHRPHEDVHIELKNGSLQINPTKLYEPGQTLGSDNAHALEENNYSLITTITFGDIRLLLAGDAEGDRIAEFAAQSGGELDFDVLKIPHHGGFDKEMGDFLRAAKGELRYCVVSVGTPDLVDASLVTAMRTSGAGVYYTYNGTVRLSTDGVTMMMDQG